MKENVSLALPLLFVLFVACAAAGPEAEQSKGAGNSNRATPAPSPKANERVYRGSLGGRGIEVRLAREGVRVEGSYIYDGIGEALRLEGRAEAGKLTLEESDAAGRRTGRFACEEAKQGDWDQDVSCNWSKPGGGGEQFVALFEQHAAFGAGVRVAAKVVENRDRGVRASVPQLAAAPGAQLPAQAAAFNRLVEGKVSAAIKNFIDGLDGGAKNVYFRVDYNVLLGTDGLVSVELFEDANWGGAHPSHTYDAVTYDLRAGRELKLADLFKPGSDYEQQLRRHSLAEIDKRAGAIEAEDARAEGRKARPREESPVSEDQLSSMAAWGMTPRGLMIHYELPHVVAVFQRNFVPYEAVREHLRPEGPAAPFASAGR
jgi:hypothetical protein